MPGACLKKLPLALENDRVWKNHHPPGRLARVAVTHQFHQRQLEQPDVDHVAADAGNLDAVADPDAVTAGNEEVAGKRQDHVLQRERDTGRRQSHHGCQRPQLAGEIEQQHQAHDQGHRQLAQLEQLAAPAQVLHIAEGQAAPDEGGDENRQQQHAERGKPDDEPAQLVAPSADSPRRSIARRICDV